MSSLCIRVFEVQPNAVIFFRLAILPHDFINERHGHMLFIAPLLELAFMVPRNPFLSRGAKITVLFHNLNPHLRGEILVLNMWAVWLQQFCSFVSVDFP